MARLNEPAAPVESIESLKRKFMRQNRDLARANSTQSLRIRNLENEISKILADNLGLREQILHLQNELDNGKSKKIADHAGAIRSQLETKLLEIGALITGLGDEAPPKKHSPRSSRLMRTSPRRSPDQRNWKNICSLSESVAAQEGRLPPILENKTYPRRTLELQELTAILAEQAANSTDSPEIGPPPVSQFVDEDPVKIDLPTKVRTNENEELGGLDPVLSANLEQRKKRRDSANISEAKKTIKNDPPNATTGSLKIGAKRKLSVRDDDENTNAKKTQVSPDDSFSYTRLNGDVRTRLGPPSEKPVTKTTRDLAVARGAPRDKTASSNISTRRVLAPKSVNDSPKKSIKQQVVDEVKAAKAEIAKSNPAVDRSHERMEDSINVRPEIEAMPETVDIEPEPETPAGLDLFSPASSQPSTARPDSRDTPPPPELGQGQEGQRPSRRARGAVSYAEPNLRDKMRRPTKELVDAVAREAARQTASAKLEEAVGNVTIKAEPEADDAWKSLPVPSSVTVEASSPLSGKVSTSTATVLPSGLISHRKRRESSLPQDTEPVRTGSGGVISALLANTRRSKGENREKSPSDEAELAKAMSNLDVYDIRCSSPSLAQETVLKTETEAKPLPRQSRRQSSVSRDLAAGDEGEVSDIEAPKRQSSFASRRRTTTLGQRSLSVTREPAKVDEGEKASRRTNGTTSDDEVGAVGTRADRVTRRRSMMI